MKGKRLHHNLLVWQESMQLVSDIYELTKCFPTEETYGLTSQLRRAAVSVPSNIAEGAGRFTKKEFLYYLSVSRGSLSEVETQLLISQSLGYCKLENSLLNKIDKIFVLLAGLIRNKEKDGQVS